MQTGQIHTQQSSFNNIDLRSISEKQGCNDIQLFQLLFWEYLIFGSRKQIQSVEVA